jgi:hypothetical protein
MCFAYRDILNAIKKSHRIVFFEDFVPNDNEVYADLIFINLYNVMGKDKNGMCNQSFFDHFVGSKRRLKIVINLKYIMTDPQQLILTNFGGMALHLNSLSLLASDDHGAVTRYMLRNCYSNIPELSETEKRIKELGIPMIYFVQAMQIWKRFFTQWDFFEFFKNPTFDNNELDLYKARENEVVVAGTQIRAIYPYRFHALHKLKNVENLKILNTVHDFNSKRDLIDSVRKDFLNNTNRRDFEVACNFHDQINEIQNSIFANYIQMLRKSKIGIGCCSVFGFPLAKYFEMMANGVLVIGQLPFDSDVYGLVDNETMVQSTISELPSKIDFYLKNPNERNRIIENAYNLTQKRYTLSFFVDSFFSKLENVLNRDHFDCN